MRKAVAHEREVAHRHVARTAGAVDVEAASGAPAINRDLRARHARLRQDREAGSGRTVVVEVAAIVAAGQEDVVVRAVARRRGEGILQVLRRGNVEIHRPGGSCDQHRQARQQGWFEGMKCGTHGFAFAWLNELIGNCSLNSRELYFEAPLAREELVVGTLIIQPFELIVPRGRAGVNIKREKSGNKLAGRWATARRRSGRGTCGQIWGPGWNARRG
jgi:hypothetical protein